MDRKAPRVFYGWWIVSASFLTALCIGGVVVYGFTSVFEPIAEEFGWSYTQISFASSLRGLEMGLFAPFSGMLADRWGPRRIIFSGVTITAAGLILLSQTTSLGMFYSAFFLAAIGLSCCTTNVLITAVANWFHQKVSIASGIATSGFGFSGLLVPLMVRLIEILDWRMTILILALGMLAILLPVSLLFRHKPEQYGYLPDGQIEKQLVTDNSPVSKQSIELDITVKEALKSGTFWRITLSMTAVVTVTNAVIVHVMPYLSSAGIAKSISSLVAMGIPLASIAGRLGIGWLGDKFNKKIMTVLGLGTMSLGLFCFGYAPSTGIWLLVSFLILFGISYGGIVVLRPALVREYFGRTKFGTIFGLIVGINMIGTIIGPTLAGWVYDTWGSYQGIWFIFAATPAAAVIAILTISPVRKPSNKIPG